MTETVACFIDRDGQLEDFNSKGTVVLYRKENNAWKISKFMGIDLSEIKQISELRELMDRIVLFLNDSKIIVVKSINGIPYFTLEKANFEIWESEGPALTVVTEIEEEIEKIDHEECKSCSKYSETDSVTIPAPVMNEEGDYSISLKEVQGHPSKTTSKQILMPFLKTGDFKKLHVACGHVPPWLEITVMEYGYDITIEKQGYSDYKVLIEKSRGDDDGHYG